MNRPVGLMPLKLGDTVKPIAIERYKASKSQKEMISILTNNIQAAHMHFIKGIGAIYCFGGACCKMDGLPTTRYIIPIIKYTMINPKQLTYGGPVYVQYMTAPKDRYEEIMTKNQLNKDITQCDILVSCSDEVYQKITMEVAGPALWRRDEALNKEVKEQYKYYNDLIGLSVARVVDESTFLRTFQAQEEAAQVLSAPSYAAPDAALGGVETALLDEGSTVIDVSTSEDGTPNFDDLLADDLDVDSAKEE